LDKQGAVISYDSDNDLSVMASDISHNVGGNPTTFFWLSRYGSAHLFCTTIQGNSKNYFFPAEPFKFGNELACQHYKTADQALCNETAICKGNQEYFSFLFCINLLEMK